MLDAGCGVPEHVAGRVMASGEGWCWVLGSGAPAHLTGPPGIRGPLGVRLADDPPWSEGDDVRLTVSGARWRGQLPAANARPTDTALAPIEADLRPDLMAAATMPMAEAITRFGGRGEGLTPEGDDLLMGLVAGRLARSSRASEREATNLAAWADTSAGEPSRSLLRHAARGELVEPAHLVLDALAENDAAVLTDAAPGLIAWGASSGRALLNGLVAGLR